MKNKRTAYILVPIVLAIWGMIGWKVYAAMKGKNDAIIVASTETTSILKTEIPDTIQLIANYRDPFLEDSKFKIQNSRFSDGSLSDKIQNSKSDRESHKVKVIEIVKPVVAWPVVAYYGLIKRNSDGKTVGFLSVNGASYFVQSGEGAGEVRVGKLWKDSVEVVWGKERRVVGR